MSLINLQHWKWILKTKAQHSRNISKDIHIYLCVIVILLELRIEGLLESASHKIYPVYKHNLHKIFKSPIFM